MGKCSVWCTLSAECSEICSGKEKHVEAVSKVSPSCGTLQAFSFVTNESKTHEAVTNPALSPGSCNMMEQHLSHATKASSKQPVRLYLEDSMSDLSKTKHPMT